MLYLAAEPDHIRQPAQITAQSIKLEVHGHLWVFDRMVEADTITGSRAWEKLSELCETINPKLGLPKAECAKRIKLWSNF